MKNELAWWYERYRTAAAEQPNMYVAARLEERMAHLYDIQGHLESAVASLEDLPRTSI